MAPPEHSYPTTASPEYSNTREAQENDLKTNFVKMTEEMKKKSLKEIEKTTKNWKKSINSFKKMPRKTKQTSEGNSLRHENGNRREIENTNRRNSGNGKSR